MCTFNTLLLPGSTSLDAVNEIASELLHRTFTVQGNAAIESAVAGARSYVRTGDCDCGAGLANQQATGGGPSERELRKLRKDGWSEAKIQRWLAQRAATQQKKAEERHRREQANRAQAADWAAFVARILDERLAPWVGLFTHDYRGAVATERIQAGETRRFVGVTVEQIEEIEEDVPFVFSAR